GLVLPARSEHLGHRHARGAPPDAHALPRRHDVRRLRLVEPDEPQRRVRPRQLGDLQRAHRRAARYTAVRCAGWTRGPSLLSASAVAASRPRPSTVDDAASRTNISSRNAHAIRPASRKTAAVHPPVASRSRPDTAGDRTAPISPIRLFMPKAAP